MSKLLPKTWLPIVAELLLKVLGWFIPDNMKVYALSAMAVIAGGAMLYLGDYDVGSSLIITGLMGIAGRHTAEKMQSDIQVAISLTNKRERSPTPLSAENLPELPIADKPLPEKEIF